MQELITICIIIAIINIVYFYFFLSKNPKKYLLVQLHEFSRKMGFEYIEDKSIFGSKIIGNQVILGKDIDFQMDISKLTELFFKMYFIKTKETKFISLLINFLFKFSFLLSIIFSVGTFVNIIFDVGEIMAYASIVITIMGILSIVILSVLYKSFKNQCFTFSNTLGEQKIKLLQTLYWYIPISVFNSVIRFIDYTRWLFSKN